jgi:hypothetical protein
VSVLVGRTATVTGAERSVIALVVVPLTVIEGHVVAVVMTRALA